MMSICRYYYKAVLAAKTSKVHELQPICVPQLFGLDFHFYVILLLIGICQSKKCASKKFDSFSLTKSTTEFECELRYCDEVYLYTSNLSAFIVCTSTWISC